MEDIQSIPVDIIVLNELRSIMADDFKMLIDVFISDSETRLGVIQAAIQSKDADGLRASAHSLKGSSLNISADTLTELCRKLEAMGKENKLEGADGLLGEVKNEFIRVKEFLVTL